MKTKWFDIEESIVNKSTSAIKRGVKVNVKLSPFDVPVGANSDFDKENGVLIINFKYYDDEKITEIKGETRGVSFFVGKHSGRLFGIRLDSSSHLKEGLDELSLELTLEQAVQDLNELASSPKRGKLRSQSKEAIQSVVNNYKDQLLSNNLEFCNGV